MKLKELIKKYGECELKSNINIEDFLEEPKPKQKSIYNLKHEDEYYYLNDVNNIFCSIWFNELDDEIRLSVGNVFPTKKEAEEESMRRTVYATVKKHSYDFSREEWGDEMVRKYLPIYDVGAGTIRIFTCVVEKCYGLHFKSREDILKAVEEVGEKNFIKYYLGVKA